MEGTQNITHLHGGESFKARKLESQRKKENVSKGYTTATRKDPLSKSKQFSTTNPCTSSIPFLIPSFFN